MLTHTCVDTFSVILKASSGKMLELRGNALIKELFARWTTMHVYLHLAENRYIGSNYFFLHFSYSYNLRFLVS